MAEQLSQLRQIKPEELANLQYEIKQLADWNAAKEWAIKYFGDAATRITYETYGEYNDEGGTDYYVAEVQVYDAQGDRLPVLQSVIDEGHTDWSRAHNYTDEEVGAEIVSEARSELPNEPQDGNYDWDLTKQPELSFSALYVEAR